MAAASELASIQALCSGKAVPFRAFLGDKEASAVDPIQNNLSSSPPFVLFAVSRYSEQDRVRPVQRCRKTADRKPRTGGGP